MTQKLTWGELGAGVGGLTVALSSLAPQTEDFAYGGVGSVNLWQKLTLINLVSVVITGVAAALATTVVRDDEKRLLDANRRQWSTVLAMVCLACSVVSLLGWRDSSWGAYVLVLGCITVVGGVIGPRFVPLLRAPIAAGSAPGPAQPYWVAVPVTRTIYRPDSPTSAVGTLDPGAWHLVLGAHAGGLLVRSADGVHGILYDIDDLQRG